MFADDSYSKPFFVTFFCCSLFALPVLPLYLKEYLFTARNRTSQYGAVSQHDGQEPAHENDGPGCTAHPKQVTSSARDQAKALLKPALTVFMLWFASGYFNAASLEHTSVASSIILSTTSGLHVMFFGALFFVERFTRAKLLGVVASIIGIALISTVDINGSSDADRGQFPSKSGAEIALGDIEAFGAAVIYGLCTILLKRFLCDSTSLGALVMMGNMSLASTALLWPFFIILHFTGVERFQLPPDARVWRIFLINGMISLVGDYSWAYAVVLTSPTVITVGLSLSIPLSLVGQMLLNGQTAGLAYWTGALIVLGGFMLVNAEANRAVSAQDEARRQDHSDET